MNHRMHTYLMIGLAFAAGVLLLTGSPGSGAFTFIWLTGCVLMMFFMMRGMGGMGHGGSREDETRDKVDHSKH